MDYADQRYYSNQFGRFMTPDPYSASGGPNEPQSWNRYAYVGNDPVNYGDARGLFRSIIGSCDDLVNGEPQEGCNLDSDPGGSLVGYGCPIGMSYNNSVDGCIADGGGLQPADPPPTPSCSIELFQRPAFFNGNPGKHSYILIFDSALPNPEQMIEGGPVNNMLTGYDNPPAAGLGKDTGHASDPTASNNHEIGNVFSGPTACRTIDLLQSFEQSYNDGPRVPYSPVPLPGSGYWNSNSFTYTLLRDVGLSTYFGSLNWFQFPGWGMTVPGL